MTERRRLLELAVHALESEQIRIQEELKALRVELNRSGAGTSRFTPAADGRHTRVAPNKGKPMTMAQRRKISAAMKRRWAALRGGGKAKAGSAA